MCIHIYVYIYIYILLFIYYRTAPDLTASQDSSKWGAVETGCSDSYDVIY